MKEEWISSIRKIVYKELESMRYKLLEIEKMEKFNEREEFCPTCLIHTTFWRGGNSWGVDRCPICNEHEAIMWKEMSFLQKEKAIKLFEERWKNERIGIFKS